MTDAETLDLTLMTPPAAMPDDPADKTEGDPEEEGGLSLPETKTLTYGYERGGAVIRPEDEGKIKGLAVRAMEEQQTLQMDKIREQYEVLVRQARELETRRALSLRVYEATIRFEPLIGRHYYLYHHASADYLSLIAPNEWGRSRRYERFIAKLRLLADHTWEVLEVAPDTADMAPPPADGA